MDTSDELQQNDGNDVEKNDAVSSSLPKVTDSPKTPIRKPLDDNLDDYTSDEMESPQFRHLIPVYNRRTCDDDLDDVRIGWDDGYGCVYYEDDDYGTERNGRRFKRSRSGRLFTERHHRSLFKSHNGNDTNSPSPNRGQNNAAIQAELNDYLGCILSCLSAKKKNRQLVKSKSEPASSDNLNDNNNVSHLLNDSTEDEMMLLCSQAVEKTISFDANYNTVNSNKLVKSNSSSVDISPLNTTNITLNSNSYHQSIKKFKPETQCKQINEKINKNFKAKCYTITSNSENTSPKETNKCALSTTNTVTNSNKDFCLNDSFTKDDDLFSAIDLSAIEQQAVSNIKKPASVITQVNDPVCTKQTKDLTILNGSDDKNSLKSSANNNHYNPSSVVWGRCNSSSSIVNKTLQTQHNIKPNCGVKETTVNSKIDVKIGSTRYCTPAEIEEKRNRARRTLMLKFKSKNRSAF